MSPPAGARDCDGEGDAVCGTLADAVRSTFIGIAWMSSIAGAVEALAAVPLLLSATVEDDPLGLVVVAVVAVV